MPILECGENLIEGIPQFGTAYGPTKKAARFAAIAAADSYVALVWPVQAAAYSCPAVECKNRNAEGVSNRTVTDIVNIRIAPKFWYSVERIDYKLRIECRYAG